MTRNFATALTAGWTSLLLMFAVELRADEPLPGATPIAAIERTEPVRFGAEILPILRQNCLACHSATKAENELVLESPETILKGGVTGPGVVPGKPAESLLLQVAAGQIEPVMPPEGNSASARRLTSDELGLLALWIAQGAQGSADDAATTVAWQGLPPGVHPIYAAAISPDGQYVACGRANQVFVYHLPTRQLAARLTDSALGNAAGEAGAAHLDLVQSLAFSPDGNVLASGGYREIKLWRRPADATRQPIPLPGNGIAAASADHKWVAQGSAEGIIRLWNAAENVAGPVLSGHSGAVTALAFSADGLSLVSTATDRTARVWNTKGGVAQGMLALPTEALSLALLPDGATFALGCADGAIRLARLPAAPAAPLATTGAPVRRSAASADGNRIAWVRVDGQVELFDVASGKIVRSWNAILGETTALALSPGGTRVAWGNATGELFVADVNSNRALPARVGSGAGAVTSLAFTADEMSLIAGGSDGVVARWPIEAEVYRQLPLVGENTSTLLSVDRAGARLAVLTSLEGKPAIVVVATENAQPLHLLRGLTEPPTTLAMSDAGNLLSAGTRAGNVVSWDLMSGARLPDAMPGSGAVASLALSPDGQMLLVGGDDGAIYLVRAADGVTIRSLAGHRGAVSAVCFSADGAQAFSAGTDGLLRRYNVADGVTGLELNVGAGVLSLAVAADAKRVAVTTVESSLRVFDEGGGDLGQTTMTPRPRVLGFSTDGARVVARDAQGRTLVWDVAARRMIASRTGGPALCDALASAGGTVFAASLEGPVVVGRPSAPQVLGVHESPIVGVALAVDGQSILWAAQDGAFGHSGGAVVPPSAGTAQRGVALSSDRAMLASAGEDGRLRVWKLADAAAAPMMSEPVGEALESVAFDRNGGYVAARTASGTVLTFQTATGALLQRLAPGLPVMGLLAATTDGAWSSFVEGRELRIETAAVRDRLPGHAGGVTTLARGASSMQLLSGGRDGKLRAWNLADGKLVREVDATSPVLAAATNADGTRWASVGEDGNLRLFNGADGALLATRQGDAAAERQFAGATALVGVAGNRLAAASQAVTAAEAERNARNEAAVKATAEVPAAVEAANQAIAANQAAQSALVSANEQVAQSAAAVTKATETKTAVEQSVATAQALLETAQLFQTAAKTSVDVLAQSATLASNTVTVASQALAGQTESTELASAKQSAEQAAAEAAMALAAAQTALATADGVLASRTATRAAGQAALDEATKALEQATAAATTATEAKTAADKTATDAAAAEKAATEKRMAAERLAQSTAVAAKLGEELLVRAQAQRVAEEELQKNLQAKLDEATARATSARKSWRSVAISSDGWRLAAAGDDGRLHLFSSTTGDAYEVWGSASTAISSVWFAADGSPVSASAQGIERWQAPAVWTLASRLGPDANNVSDVRRSPLADRVVSLDFSPDGALLASGGGEPSRSGEVKVWRVGDGNSDQAPSSTADGTLAIDFGEPHSDTVFGLSFSPDGRMLATCAADKFVKVFDVASGKLLRSLEGHTHHVLAVRWKFDFSLLASAGADKVVKVWNVDSGEQQRTIAGFGKEVTGLQFLAGLPQILTSAGDGAVRLHNVDDGKTLRSYTGPGAFLYSVVGTPDGGIVAAGGEDGVLWVWNGADAKPLVEFGPSGEMKTH